MARLSELLDKIARPYRCDEMIPVDLQANLWQLGVPCEPTTPRELVIARVWARKRSLQMTLFPVWGGPGAFPPSAA